MTNISATSGVAYASHRRRWRKVDRSGLGRGMISVAARAEARLRWDRAEIDPTRAGCAGAPLQGHRQPLRRYHDSAVTPPHRTTMTPNRSSPTCEEVLGRTAGYTSPARA